MLAVTNYKSEFVEACRAGLAARLDEFRALPEGKAKTRFAPGYFNAMLLVLDSYFLHRQRSLEGKAGGPLNELRMLCNGLKGSGGVLERDSTIKYDARKSVTGIEIGAPIALDEPGFERLAAAVFAEITEKYHSARAA